MAPTSWNLHHQPGSLGGGALAPRVTPLARVWQWPEEELDELERRRRSHMLGDVVTARHQHSMDLRPVDPNWMAGTTSSSHDRTNGG
jgi:hypothetical protein